MAIRVIAHSYIEEKNMSAAKILYKEMIELTLKEDGCIEYKLHVDHDDSTHLVFIETWESKAHLDAHISSDHFKRIIPQVSNYQYKNAPMAIVSELVF